MTLYFYILYLILAVEDKRAVWKNTSEVKSFSKLLNEIRFEMYHELYDEGKYREETAYEVI